MKEQFVRSALLLGENGIERLNGARVAIFGIGGVGGFAAEALARAGVGSFLLVDNDEVSVSNINRQVIATWDTVGKKKTQVMKERILSIYPQACVETKECFFLPQNAGEIDFSMFDYVIDAVDTVSAKLEIIRRAKEAQVPVLSCMGAGNKLDAAQFQVADIFETKGCPLARVMRRELKKREIGHCKVVYSTEGPRKPLTGIVGEADQSRREIPGSVSFVPPVAGLIAAGEVVKDLLGL